MAQTGNRSLEPTRQQAEDAVRSFTEFRELIQEARAGSSEALGRLLQSCRSYLLLVANEELDGALWGKVAPSDAVQETLAQACRKLDQFRGESREEWLGWLKAILHNEVRATERMHRAQKRDVRREIAATDSRTRDLSARGRSPRSGAVEAEEAQRLREALLCLSEDHRRVILLRSWKELSFAEVAQLMGRSEDAARKLWVRAMERLERELNRHGSQEDSR